MKKTEMQELNLCKNTTEKSRTPVGNQSIVQNYTSKSVRSSKNNSKSLEYEDTK